MQIDKSLLIDCSQAITYQPAFFIATIQIGVIVQICYTPLARCVTYTCFQLLPHFFLCKTCDVTGLPSLVGGVPPICSQPCGREINGTETTWHGQDQIGSPLMTGIKHPSPEDQLLLAYLLSNIS